MILSVNSSVNPKPTLFKTSTMSQYIEFLVAKDEDNQNSREFLAQLKETQSWTSINYYTMIQDALDNHGIKMVFYKPKESYGFKERVYGIMLSSHADYELETLAKKCDWPRGFPIMWYPNQQRIKFFGFRPKFKNDQRQKKTNVENIAGFAYFQKWSGFLGQPITMTIDGKNYWTFASKNSLNSQQKDSSLNNFVEDGARIMAPHMTPEVIDLLVETGIHVVVEVLSKNDQNHGARVLKEGAIVTTMAKGVDLYLSEKQEVNPPQKKRGFNTYHGFVETIRFASDNNLLVGSAVFATGSAAKRLLESFNEKRDHLSLQQHNTILESVIQCYPNGIHIQKGTTDHRIHLGDILEGMVLHIVTQNQRENTDDNASIRKMIEMGETTVEKFKLPPYVVRTMAIRPVVANDFNTGNLPRLLEHWGDMWCVSEEGASYWKNFVWQVMLHYNEYINNTNPELTAHMKKYPNVALHIVLSDYVLEHGLYDDLDNKISCCLQMILPAISIVGCHVVVLPFADVSHQQAVTKKLQDCGLEVTSGKKKPKNVSGWVRLTTMPTLPDDSITQVYEIAIPESQKPLEEWQRTKHLKVSQNQDIVRLSSIENVIECMKTDHSNKQTTNARAMSNIQQREMEIRKECEETIKTIIAHISRNEQRGKKTIVLLIAPQCFGKSTITETLMKRGDFMDASADKHMGSVFNPANLEKAHKKCRETVFDAVYHDGLNVVVDNTNIHPEHRSMYAKMADVLGSVYLPVIVGSKLWFNCSDSDRLLTCETLTARSQARGALTSKIIKQEVIAKTIMAAENSFIAHTNVKLTTETPAESIQKWLDYIPQPDHSNKMGFNIDSMTLKFRSPALSQCGKMYLENERIRREVDELEIKRLYFELSRGMNDFYATIISPSEMKKTKFMKTPSGKNPKTIVIDGEPTVKGVGRLIDTDSNKEAIFMVIEWEEAQEFRKSLGLEPKDFHVTLAFKNDDIHDQRKNEVAWC